MLNVKNINKNSGDFILELDSVKKLYDSGSGVGYMALKGISLKIGKGQFVSVVGKSGSGKSTMLNLLGGIDRPTEGAVNINGIDINKLSESQLTSFRAQNLGFIFQFFQLMPTLTVLENVIMPMDFAGRIPKRERVKRASMLLSKVGILNQSHKYPDALSGGEQQRVAIARALSNDPQLILADEPTGNLDSQTTEDIFNLLKELSKEGKNVVMVTHNNELAARCERIIQIKDGLIIEDIINK